MFIIDRKTWGLIYADPIPEDRRQEALDIIYTAQAKRMIEEHLAAKNSGKAVPDGKA